MKRPAQFVMGMLCIAFALAALFIPPFRWGDGLYAAACTFVAGLWISDAFRRTP